MEEKKVHLATKASFEVRSTVSDVVFREESEFEVKMVQNHQKTHIFHSNFWEKSGKPIFSNDFSKNQ